MGYSASSSEHGTSKGWVTKHQARLFLVQGLRSERMRGTVIVMGVIDGGGTLGSGGRGRNAKHAGGRNQEPGRRGRAWMAQADKADSVKRKKKLQRRRRIRSGSGRARQNERPSPRGGSEPGSLRSSMPGHAAPRRSLTYKRPRPINDRNQSRTHQAVAVAVCDECYFHPRHPLPESHTATTE